MQSIGGGCEDDSPHHHRQADINVQANGQLCCLGQASLLLYCIALHPVKNNGNAWRVVARQALVKGRANQFEDRNLRINNKVGAWSVEYAIKAMMTTASQVTCLQWLDQSYLFVSSGDRYMQCDEQHNWHIANNNDRKQSVLLSCRRVEMFNIWRDDVVSGEKHSQ